MSKDKHQDLLTQRGLPRGAAKAVSPAVTPAVQHQIPQEVLEHHYDLTGRELGRGAFGIVSEARSKKLGQAVAVKRLPVDHIAPADRLRFIREVGLVAPLLHPNIIRLLDWGEDAQGLWLVMELVHGSDLNSILRQRGPIPPVEVCGWMLQVCYGLQSAHTSGLIHRDIKPANLLLDRFGVVKVSDFGLVRRSVESDKITQTGQQVGTRSFASPEQLEGVVLDTRTDLFSLGATMFHLLAGPAVRERQFDLQQFPAHIAQVLRLALAEDRQHRFQTAEEFAAAIVVLQAELQAEAWAVAAPIRPQPAPVAPLRPQPVTKKQPQPLTSPCNGKVAAAAQQDWSDFLGIPLQVENSLGMNLRLIPPGTFQMGSPAGQGNTDEQPQHSVKLTRPFYLAATQVTQAQWRKLMGNSPWKGKQSTKDGDRHAVSYVNWDDAMDFCRLLSEQEDRKYRLPTEAEWEYACRAGTQTRYSFGDGEVRLDLFGWYDGNKLGQYAHEVAQKQPNPFGLYDMHGNVWEWCSDWYDEKYYGKSPEKDPAGPPSGSSRVLRGGGWGDVPIVLRSCYRDCRTPGGRDDDVGLRVLCELE
jgi:formylglycine-generating enzyme required for sulfatase activity